jgi:S1-C subfamily serine protease
MAPGSADTPPAAPNVNALVRHTLASVVQLGTDHGVVGAGLVLDSQGHILTNSHLIGHSKRVGVGVYGISGALPATVVGTYSPDDLVLIKLDSPPPTLQPVEVADSSKALIGEPVVAMGFPLGTPGSVTTGVISAVGRTITQADLFGAATIPNVLQTSAAINPGNIGGALVDNAGKVVGMPIAAGSADPPGIGYAIPASTLTDIAAQLGKSGRLTTSKRSWIGVGVRSVTRQGAPAGAQVATVHPGSPAAAAGLKSGDIITHLGTAPIPNAVALRAVLADTAPGPTVPITLASPTGRTRTLQIALAPLLNP